MTGRKSLASFGRRSTYSGGYGSQCKANMEVDRRQVRI